MHGLIGVIDDHRQPVRPPPPSAVAAFEWPPPSARERARRRMSRTRMAAGVFSARGNGK
jgi:hypothetical protein